MNLKRILITLALTPICLAIDVMTFKALGFVDNGGLVLTLILWMWCTNKQKDEQPLPPPVRHNSPFGKAMKTCSMMSVIACCVTLLPVPLLMDYGQERLIAPLIVPAIASLITAIVTTLLFLIDEAIHSRPSATSG